jgi:hypothetical protein
MSLNKSDRQQVVKTAEQKGYSWTSSGSGMTNGSGGSLKFSASRGSVNVNGSRYNSAADARKSKRW